MSYKANEKRYDKMIYNRCGKSGLLLPVISLGLWKNFGSVDSFSNAKKMLFKAFDLGITHFDLANNYGPVYGSAEANFGRIFIKDLKRYRDELMISTKAGYDMWPGPYGNWGSRKYLVSSLDQSLKRMKLEYVDIFYHHRFDPETPLEETLGALDQIVKSGKALYAGISNYGPKETESAVKYLKSLNTPFIIHQAKYSMFVRTPEAGLIDVLKKQGVGLIVFSPLAQGLLSGKYNDGIPKNSRATKFKPALDLITNENIEKTKKLKAIADKRGQSITQLALAWVLRDKTVTSALIGASSIEQIEENVKTFDKLDFDKKELDEIEKILK